MIQVAFHNALLATLLAVVITTGTAAKAALPDQQIGTQARDPAEELRRSSDLRVRIVYSTEMMVETDANGAFKRLFPREIVPAAELVEQARGATDPIVLDLMTQRCGNGKARGGCEAVDFAHRWTVVDTQNQVAWLTLASVLKAQGDLDGARTTFLRAASASSWHDHYRDIAHAVLEASPRSNSPRMRNALLVNALGQAGSSGLPWNAIATLGAFCKDDGDVRAACARIVATMARDTDTTIGLTLAAPYARRAAIDSLVAAGYQLESDAIHWSIQSIAKASANIDPDNADDDTLRRDNARMQAMIDLGERRMGEAALLDRHITKGEAAALFVANLSPSQLEQRRRQTTS